MTDAEPASAPPSEEEPAAKTAEHPAAEGAPSHRALFELPDGWFGVLLLVMVASVSSGLIVAYWPSLTGGGAPSEERLSALETRVNQIATGQAGAAANSVFDDIQHSVSALDDRVAAAEARLTALENTSKSQTVGGNAAGQAPSPDVTALRSALDGATAELGALSKRVDALEANTGASVLDALKGELAADEKRIATLESDLAAKTADQTRQLAALSARVAALESNAPPANLAARLDALTPKSDTDALAARLATLEMHNSPATLHRAAMVLAAGELARAIAGPNPFTVPLQSFAAVAPDNPVLAQLRPLAPSGVPTRAILTARFPAVARAALDAERNAAAKGFFARVWNNFKSLIAVRRVGDVAGATSDARLARAQAALDKGDLAGALTEVAALTGPAAEAGADWRRDAAARQTLDRAADTLNAQVVAALEGAAANGSDKGAAP